MTYEIEDVPRQMCVSQALKGDCWMSHCRGSPSLVTLVQVGAYLDPIVGSAHAYLTKCQ